VYLGAPPRGQPQLHRRSAERREIQPIPGTIGATRPFFSPDGQWIAFHAAGKLRKAPITGGSAADIAEMQASPEAVWMEDGRILLATWKGIAVVPSSGGVPRSILPADTLRGERIYRSPVPIDGGRTILYVVFQFGGAPTGRLAAVSADGERRAVPDVHMLRLLGLVDRHLVYVRGDGTVLARPFDVGRLVFTGEPFPLAGGVHAKVGFGGADAALSTSGALAFVHYPRTNRLLRRDPDGNVRAFVDEPGDIGTPRLSPSGAQLLTVRTSVTAEGRQRHDLWLYDVAARTPTRLTSDSASWYGEWAVDGRGVFFKGSLTGSDTALGELWYKALDGSAPRRIIADVEFFALHPNGRQLLYTAYDRSGKQAVWMRGITADTTPRRLPMLHESEIGHRISPDGRWIAYSSNSSGTDQVYVRPLLGGGEVQISAEGGYEPRWSRDGRLYFRDGKQFYVASITTSPRLAVPKRDTLFADDETITSWYDTPSYDVTADGSFLITKRLASPRIVVTLGWTTLLRARIAESRR